jgi:D-glycero-D-manno-heptose 1,7-bisphosphate phosphatase
MLLRAKEEFDVDLSSSFLVGDKWSDIKCGQTAGAATSLVMTGYGRADYQRCIDDRIKIDYLAENLFDALNNFVKKRMFAK